MAKPRSKAVDFTVYLLVRIVLCIFQALSLETCSRLADRLAWLLYHLDRRHRLVADDNLRHAFKDRYTPQQRDALVRAVYRHFCTMMMEVIHMPRRLRATNWKERQQMVDSPAVLRVLLSPRPVMVVSAHFGNWELAGWILALLGLRTTAIARRLDNPYLDAMVRGLRERSGQRLVNKQDDFEQIERVLVEGGILGTLADQDAGQRGLFVDFFGRPASTHKAIALLSLAHDAPVLVIATRRTPRPPGCGSWDDRMFYRVVLGDVIDPRDYKDQGDAVAAITQRFTSAIEKMVREAPEQYFWLHRRWKHQPRARKGKQAA
jgi:KDO2-lipid IV(A) lauroyltransferase